MTKKKNPQRLYVREYLYNFTMTANSLIRTNYQHWLNGYQMTLLTRPIKQSKLNCLKKQTSRRFFPLQDTQIKQSC